MIPVRSVISRHIQAINHLTHHREIIVFDRRPRHIRENSHRTFGNKSNQYVILSSSQVGFRLKCFSWYIRWFVGALSVQGLGTVKKNTIPVPLKWYQYQSTSLDTFIYPLYLIPIMWVETFSCWKCHQKPQAFWCHLGTPNCHLTSPHHRLYGL